MLHPLATASASSANPSTKAMSSAIPLVRTAAFHCSKRTGPSCFRELSAKILRKLKHHSNGRVTLDKVLQISRLLARAVVYGSDHQQCNPSGRSRLVPDNGLFRDSARSFGTKGAQPHLKCAPRSRVSPPRQFPRTRLSTLWHPWFHRDERRGQVRINDGRSAGSSERRWRRFLCEGTIDTARYSLRRAGQSALCDSLLDTVSRSAYADAPVGDDEHGALVRLVPAPLPSLQDVPCRCCLRLPF